VGGALHGVNASSLYRGPLDGFVARRDALVRELRSTDREASVVAGKLRKPAVTAWAIDQLASDEPDVVLELLAAGADARESQQAFATQSPDRDDFARASTRLRDAVEAAARATNTVLEAGGHATSDDAIRRITTTLQAAATGNAEERLALWLGTLDQDLAPSGFGAVDDPQDDDPELATAIASLRHRASAARRPVVVRTSPTERLERERAERATEELERGAGKARALADAKRVQADKLAEQARDAEEAASAAEQAADAAEHTAGQARAALDR
jgi:hypothetical protein